MKLYLVRHGQTDWNVARKFQGDTDIPLNQTGIEQAHMVKEKLNNINIYLCISSPLSRTLETARIICDNQIPIITNQLLIERDLGEYEGKIIEESHYDGSLYWDYKLNLNDKGVESIKDLFKRCEEFLNQIKEEYKDKNLLIVSHGATIRAIHYIISSYSEEEKFLKFDVPNCCLFEYNL